MRKKKGREWREGGGGKKKVEVLDVNIKILYFKFYVGI